MRTTDSAAMDMQTARPARMATAYAVSLALLLSQVGIAAADDVLPDGGQVTSGEAGITQSRNAMTVNQSTDRAIIHWRDFSVGEGNSVTFNQPGSTSSTLNRVTGGTRSTIAGTVSANGRIYFVNPNGIEITGTGTVKVGGGFVASTLDIRDEDFNAGRLTFSGNGASAGVSNAGVISTAEGGHVALIGGSVSNSGTILAPVGKVALGSGERATLDLTGDGFLQVGLPSNATTAEGRALVDVSGKVTAARVELKAATAAKALRQAVNMSGVIAAKTAYMDGGAIVLDGGEAGHVTVKGKLDAAGRKKGGKITVVSGTTASETRLEDATVTVASEEGEGGHVQVTGWHVGLIGTTRVDATGATGGGTVEVGGGWQGTGPLAHARAVYVASSAGIDASAVGQGKGGTVVLWSDGFTNFNGKITARGGRQGGNGGAVETSSKGRLGVSGTVDVGASRGKGGNWLLDPDNITIAASGTNIPVNTAIYEPGVNVTISAASLKAALEASTGSVELWVKNGLTGDIIFDTPFSYDSEAILVLMPRGKVIFNYDFVASKGALEINGEGVSGAGKITAVGINFRNSTAITVPNAIKADYIRQLSTDLITFDGDLTVEQSISAYDMKINGRLSSSADIKKYNGTIYVGKALTIGSNDAAKAIILEGEISGSGTFRKVGANVLTLLGPNTYTGKTTVSEGELRVGDGTNDTATAGTGGITVDSGAKMIVRWKGVTSNSFVQDVVNNGTLDIYNVGKGGSGTADLNLAGIITGTGSMSARTNGNLVVSKPISQIGNGSVITLFAGRNKNSTHSLSQNNLTINNVMIKAGDVGTTGASVNIFSGSPQTTNLLSWILVNGLTPDPDHVEKWFNAALTSTGGGDYDPETETKPAGQLNLFYRSYNTFHLSGTPASRSYDGTNSAATGGATVSMSDGDKIAGGATLVLEGKNAGSQKVVGLNATITTGGNSNKVHAKSIKAAVNTYTVTITKKVLTISGTQVADKSYDGTTNATVKEGALSGLVSGETLNVSATGTFDSAVAGPRTVTVTYTLQDGAAGGSASNYELAPTTHFAKIVMGSVPVNPGGGTITPPVVIPPVSGAGGTPVVVTRPTLPVKYNLPKSGGASSMSSPGKGDTAATDDSWANRTNAAASGNEPPTSGLQPRFNFPTAKPRTRADVIAGGTEGGRLSLKAMLDSMAGSETPTTTMALRMPVVPPSSDGLYPAKQNMMVDYTRCAGRDCAGVSVIDQIRWEDLGKDGHWN